MADITAAWETEPTCCIFCAFAVKKYKSHRQVGLPSEIMALIRARCGAGAVGVPDDV